MSDNPVLVILFIIIHTYAAVFFWGKLGMTQPWKALFCLSVIPVFVAATIFNVWLTSEYAPWILEVVDTGTRKRERASAGILAAIPIALLITYCWYLLILVASRRIMAGKRIGSTYVAPTGPLVDMHAEYIENDIPFTAPVSADMRPGIELNTDDTAIEIIPIRGFDPDGDPEIHRLANGQLRLIFNFMPPSWMQEDEDDSMGRCSNFDKELEQAIGAAIRWEDREIFLVERPRPNTMASMTKFLADYRRKNDENGSDISMVVQQPAHCGDPIAPVDSKNFETGFVCVGAREDDTMKAAYIGARVRTVKATGRARWIHVYSSLESLRIDSGWPLKIWQVEIVEKATEKDAHLADIGQRRTNAQHTRAIEVKVIGEVPYAQLFGLHTHAVYSIVEKARRLDVATVALLASAAHPAAADAFSKAWNKWLLLRGIAPPDDGYKRRRHISADGARSPVNEGFDMIDLAVNDRASELVGDAAFVEIEIGVDLMVSVFEPTWSAACDALMHAAMAFGAPELMDAKDMETLSCAWRIVFGDAPESGRASM